MTEWQVVTIIVVLIGLISAVVTPMIKLNSTLVRLSTLIEQLDNRNKTEHDVMSEELAQHTHQLADHEHRITVLEQH